MDMVTYEVAHIRHKRTKGWIAKTGAVAAPRAQAVVAGGVAAGKRRCDTATSRETGGGRKGGGTTARQRQDDLDRGER
jgi:hypothetical protein